MPKIRHKERRVPSDEEVSKLLSIVHSHDDKASIERITLHQLRHCFATYTLLSHGDDIKAVSEMLRHADVGITLKIYHYVDAKSIQQMHREYSPFCKLEADITLA